MKYPGLNKSYQKEKISYANRGMSLENLLNETNNYYIEKGIALIYKKPTPIGISKVSYVNGKQIIKEGFFQSPSTLDYNGVYKGYYIDFDAKETTSKTSFPLTNIHPHQLIHIRRVIKHQGITFLIIKMCATYFLFPDWDLIDFIDNNNRKSIPLEYIKEKSYVIKEGFIPPLDYIKALDLLIKEKTKNDKEIY